MKTTKLLILIIVISLNTVLAQESTDSPNLANDKAPELATFEINKLSYSFEQTLPDLSKAFLDMSPADRADGIAVGNLSLNGNNQASIMQLCKEIEEGKHGKYDGLLISHQGKLVFESYYKKGRINLPHFQASVTKAYISLAIGRAIQLGYLTMDDLHKPITHFLKDIKKNKLTSGVDNITLHQLMTMRSGIRVNNDRLTQIMAISGINSTKEVLKHSTAISSETQTFKYQGTDPRITWQILDRVVPESAEDFMKNEVLSKIGITTYGWKDDVEGCNMTSRDMLKLGSLVINKGKWNDEQLISAEYLARATSNVTKPTEDWIPDTFTYGYFWYQTVVSVGSKNYKAIFAWGGGGQYIVTVEELDLMVVITGHDAEDKIMTQITETIIPAFAKDDSALLEAPYLGQKRPGVVAELFTEAPTSTKKWMLESEFAPKVKEFYLTTSPYAPFLPTVIVFRKEKNNWKKYNFHQYGNAGNILYSDKKYIERTDSGWSEIKSLGSMFDREDWGIMRLSVSDKGTYVFDDYKNNDVIRISRIENGKREEPRLLSKEINTGKWTAHPFIAPDESYLIWDSEREGGHGDSDIYISFRQKNDTWGAAINLGDKVNTAFSENGAWVTLDGKYLFFDRSEEKVREDGTTYWVGNKYWVDFIQLKKDLIENSN